MQFLIPLYYRRIAENDAVNGTIAFSSLINVLGPVYLVLAASTVAAASALTTLLLAEAYAETSHFLLLGACVECCRVLANVLGNAAQVNRRMRALIWPYALGALVLLSGLAIGAIVGLPLQQAIYALPVASVIMLAVMFIQMRRELRFVLDVPRWSAAGTIVVVGLAWAWLAPPQVDTQGEAFLLMASVGFVGSLFILALLWRNPALEELTRVQLSTKKMNRHAV